MKTDKDIALEIIAGCSNLFDIEHRIVPRLIVVLAAVRKEAREAAFRDAVVAAKAHQSAVRDRHYGVVTLVIEAIEAAANDEEGE